MPALRIYEYMKRAFQETVGPNPGSPHITESHRLNGRIAALEASPDVVDAKVASLRTEIVSMKHELHAEIRRLDARVDTLERELRSAIEIRERLAALEARQRP